MFILSFVVTTWFFQRMFWLLSVIWEVTDQWNCVLRACSCLIYAHDIANVLVSVAWLFCLLLSWGDFFSKNVLIDRDYEKIPTSEACVCLSLFDLCSWRRGCVGQWGMFYAFCCHEAILLKIDWWSRYRLFWLVELLIYLNNDFGFEYFFWSLKLVIAFVVIVFKCLFSQPYVWRSWSQNFGLVEGVIYLFWFRGVHFSRVTALINCYE